MLNRPRLDRSGELLWVMMAVHEDTKMPMCPLIWDGWAEGLKGLTALMMNAEERDGTWWATCAVMMLKDEEVDEMCERRWCRWFECRGGRIEWLGTGCLPDEQCGECRFVCVMHWVADDVGMIDWGSCVPDLVDDACWG